MDRETFAGRFRDAADACRRFASQYLVEELPQELRFRVRLNSSYDGNPLHADEVVYPEDSAPERRRQVSVAGEDQVIETLWRAGRVPEWADLSVIGVTPAVTIIEVLACGRFTANDEILYHLHEGRPPFHVVGPALPLNWVEGQRFSVYYRTYCASGDELEAMRPHAKNVWSLELEGAMATDETLLALPDMPNVEILEINDGALRGPGLTALARCPELRIVRIRGVADAFDASSGPTLKRLEEITIAGLRPQPSGIEAWANRSPSLERLSLGASGDLDLEDPLPPDLDDLTLAGSRLAGATRFPQHVESLSLHLSQQDPSLLEVHLAPVRQVKSLSLRGTPVGDELLSRFLARWKINYLDVVDTEVSAAFLRRLALERPRLKMYPVPDLSEITREQVVQRVELELARKLRFPSFHGITPHDLRAALLEPYPIAVTSWRGASPRRMWAILREVEGHLVLFDPRSSLWVVAERGPQGFIERSAAQGLDLALTRFGLPREP